MKLNILFSSMALGLALNASAGYWTPQTPGGTQWLFSIQFTDASHGFCVGSNGTFLKTVNGGITVELPASVAADIHAETVNGSIETDFPLTVTGKFVGRRIDGVIGGGGRRLELETVNGSIALRKAS